MSNLCNPGECFSNLYQFKCATCPGKLSHHKYRLWYERVTPTNGEKPTSVCYSCKDYEDERCERKDQWDKDVKDNPRLAIEKGKDTWKLVGRDGKWVAEIAVQDFTPIVYKKEAIPRGLEEGVFICFFPCKCGRKYVVKCEMQDTAKCYGCLCQNVKPCHFQPRTHIKRQTDNVHSCSKCNGQPGCPNMGRPVAFG